MPSGLFCNITQRPFLKSPYCAFVLCCIGLGLHFVAGYPGGMTPDSFDQYQQSLSGNFSPAHPPLMAYLWSVFHQLHITPSSMFLFSLALLWCSVYFVFIANTQNKYRFIFLLLPFTPNLLSENTMIWKDIIFAHGILFCITLAIYQKQTSERINILVLLVSFIVTLYSMAIKFQAKFIAPFLFWAILTPYTANKNIRLALSLLLSLLFWVANTLMINSISFQEPTWQRRQFFDIAAIVYALDDDKFMPDYIINSDEYSFDQLKKKFTSKRHDYMVWPDPLYPYITSVDAQEIKQLDDAFWLVVKQHPVLYLTHRLKSFGFDMLAVTKPNFYRLIDSTLAAQHNISTQYSSLQKIIVNILKYYPRFLTANLVHFLMLFAGIYIIKYYIKEEHIGMEINFITISFAYSAAMLFTIQAADYRYYYVVRLLTLFALPIFLYNLRAKQESS